jgi:hypothetical protein
MSLLLFIVLLFIVYIIAYNIVYNMSNVKEGYESLDSCLKQGYPKWFCFEVPVQSCLTENC